MLEHKIVMTRAGDDAPNNKVQARGINTYYLRPGLEVPIATQRRPFLQGLVSLDTCTHCLWLFFHWSHAKQSEQALGPSCMHTQVPASSLVAWRREKD